MKKMLIMVVMFSLLTSVSALAGNQLPQEHECLEASGQLSLRASSPDASFGTKGEKIGWIRHGEAVKVISAKQHLTVFGFEVWVEVVSVQNPSTKGWVFDGMSEQVLKGKGKLQASATEAQVLAKLE